MHADFVATDTIKRCKFKTAWTTKINLYIGHKKRLMEALFFPVSIPYLCHAFCNKGGFCLVLDTKVAYLEHIRVQRACSVGGCCAIWLEVHGDMQCRISACIWGCSTPLALCRSLVLSLGPVWLAWLILWVRCVQSSNAWLLCLLRHLVTLNSTLWHLCYPCTSSLTFLFLTEAILSGGSSDGSLSSESGESDDEYDLSKGRFLFCVL